MFPEFHISPFSISIVTIDVLFVYFIGYLLLLRQKSAATWYLIGFFSCIAAVFFAFLIIYGTVEPRVARIAWRVLHVMVFGSVCLIQFAYHFPDNRNPREARFVLIVSTLLSSYGWAAYLYRTQDALPVYVFDANSYNYFGIVEPGAIIGVQMVWAIIVLFRRAAALSDAAPADVRGRGWRAIAPRVLDFVRRVARVENRYGRACRSFALIFIAPSLMVLSIPLAYLGFISWEVMAYFYTVGVIAGFVSVYLTYVANAPEPTTFLIKITGISLAMLLVVLGFLGTLGVIEASQAYDRARLREIKVLQARLTPLDKRDIPPAAAYITEYEIAKREAGKKQGRFLYRAALKPGAPAAVATSLNVRLFRKESDAAPDSFFIAYAFKQAGKLYEVGYPYIHYRRAIHASALAMTFGILASAIFVSLFLPLFFRGSLVLPLRSLLGGVRRVNDGDLTVHVPVGTEDEIGYLSRSFNNMVNSVRRAYEIKDEFLANTSHELRTPLHGIIGIGESLSRGVAGDVNVEQARNLAMMTASAKRLANLVNDILDFSRLKSREIKLNKTPVDMGQVTAIVLAISRPLLAGKDIELVNAVPGELPAVEGDENRLQQIMHNLVGNAVKFTDQGEIRVEARVQDDAALITVRDTGIGIPADRLDDVFQPFEQGDAVVDKRFGGTGIGLSITKQLVELHGGVIEIHSREGRGTEVSFTVPLSAKDAEPTDANGDALNRLRDEEFAIDAGVPSRAGEERKAAGERKRVLIVDDEPLNIQVLVNILKLEDYELLTAADGREALSILEREGTPDLILLDIMMPRMSGYEVCRRVRERWSAVELPVILITARNQVADLVEGFNCGANDYLTKPVIRRELLARMETHLELARISDEQLRSRMRAAEERRRVISEVHDNIGSRIGAALMHAGELPEAEPLRVLLQSALRNARDLASILNMNTTPERSWEDDIRDLAGTYDGILGFSMSVDFDPVLNDADLGVRLHVTRILQEWISNCMRHGRARKFELGCLARTGGIVIRLRTDGRGFSWHDRLPSTSPGVGLRSIAERIQAMGGRGRSFARSGDENPGSVFFIRLPGAP